MAKRDYYDVLGVSRSADSEEIKSAYRRMARKYHPDVNKSADAPQMFREATEAYEVLSDPQRRKAYNRFGHADAQAGRAGAGGAWSGRAYRQAGGAWPGGGGFSMNFEDVMRAAQGSGSGGGFMGMSLEEILSALRGGGRRRRSAKTAAKSAAQHLEHEVTIGFMQAVRGTTATVRIHTDGAGGSRETETLEVKIPPGVREGAKIRVRGKGQEGPHGPGDLYILVHVRPHPYFRRDGDDIYVDLPISITEAALGAKVDVPTLDGMSTVTIPPGTPSSRRLRLRGKGVRSPGKSQPGDLYAVIKVVPPKEISAQGAETLRRFHEQQPYDPRADVPWK